MQFQEETPCIRCGKIRVFKRQWKEVLEKGSTITHTETVCPDPECQKIVEAEFARKREKRLAFENGQNSRSLSAAPTKKIGIKI